MFLMAGTPAEKIMEIAMGYTLPRSLHVVAELGIADALEDTPQTADDLAAATGTNPEALNRVLRLLAAHGVFEWRDGGYAHTTASRLLRSDHPHSMRPLVRLQGIPALWSIWGHLDHSVRTGGSAAHLALPDGYWGHFATHPADRRIFDDAMKMKVRGQIAGLLGAYDFSAFRTIADIGGGEGHLLQAILAATPGAQGVLFDLPEVIEHASTAASNRLRLQAGSFFEDTIPVCDAYLLTQVIHNWSDEESARILTAIRRSAPRGAKLLLIEWLIPDDGKPNWTLFVDLIMLAEFTGRERTEREFKELLAQTGFQLDRVLDAGLNTYILEASAV
jgi:hypothetical protein